MARTHAAGCALSLALVAAIPAQDPPPPQDPVQQLEQKLIDDFHRVMPRSPAELRQADVRRACAAEALPVLRAVRAFAQQHPGTQVGTRGLEFTIWSVVLGDDTAIAPLRDPKAAGDASSRLLLDSGAVIAAADAPQRAAAIDAVAKGLASRDRPASEAAANSATSCLLMAGDLSVAEATLLAKNAAVPAVAQRFTEAAEAAAKDPRLLVGKPIELAGKLLSGPQFSTTSLQGKVVVVDFWATWCGPCVRALPELVELRRKHGARGVELVGVSSDRDQAALERFLGEHKDVDWPQLFERGITGFHPLADRFGVTAIPRLFVIDKKGVLRSVDARDKLDELVTRLLAE